jgi:hypothetical protein
VTRCDGMTTLVGGQVAPVRGKEADDTNWTDPESY